MNDQHELSDAPLSNGAALDAPVIPMATTDVVAKSKPKKKKKKKAKVARNLGAELREQASATTTSPTAPPVPSHEETPSPSIVQGDGGLDRGERFREAVRPVSTGPTDVAPIQEQLAPPLRLRIARGEFDKYVVIAVCTFVAALGAAVGFGLIPIPV